MFPLSNQYFNQIPAACPDDHLVVYSSDSTIPGMPNHPSFAVGYNAAKGSTFEEVVQGNMNNFEEKLRSGSPPAMAGLLMRKCFMSLG